MASLGLLKTMILEILKERLLLKFWVFTSIKQELVKNVPNIADYDSEDYDYTKFWEKRSYVDKSEKEAIECFYKKFILQKNQSGYFIDIGGSFGRLDDLNKKYFKNRVILDYSIEMLKKAKEINDRNLFLVAANCYKMPFKKNSFNFATSVRLIHHLEDLDTFFGEVFRILGPDSFFFFEGANKIHFKSVIKNLLRLNFSFFDKKPFCQPISKEGLFLNFHPKFVIEKLKNSGFEKPKKVFSVSNFRFSISENKKFQNFFLFLDKVLKVAFSKINFGPSIFYSAIKPSFSDLQENKKELKDFEEILCCPICKGNLRNLFCENCQRMFKKIDGIYDFRVI